MAIPGLRILLGSRFARQVFTLSAGSVIGQAIPLLASPLLTRIYSAEEFGAYVLMLAISAVLLTLSSLRYDGAILQTRRSNQLKTVVLLGTVASLFLNGFLALVILLIMGFGALPAPLEGMGYWLLAIPLLTVANAFQSLLVAVNIKDGRFRAISVSTVQKAFASVAVQLTLGWLGFGLAGLVAGSLLASLAANRRLLEGKLTLLRKPFPRQRQMLAVARRFLQFPLYTMPASLINSLALNSVVLLLGLHHSTHDIGQFGLAQRSIAAPMKTVSDAVGQVFLQRASDSMDNPAALRSLYLKTGGVLAVIATAVLLPASFWLEDAFAIIFGEGWRMAGELSLLLLPLVAIRFIVSPISGIVNFRRLNAFGMIMQVAILAGSVLSLLAAWRLGLPFGKTVALYAAFGTVTYVAFGLAAFNRLR
jgi:O-antigen/teichoic acid export membrane protein